MTAISSSWRIAAAVGLALAGLAALIVALTSSSGSAVAQASAVSPSAIYPALKSTEPSGITLFSAPSQQAGDSGPSFPLNPPNEAGQAEHWPISTTIRRVTVGVPGVSAWIAESYGGGVCALASDGETPSAVGFSCSPTADLEQGAGVELRDMPSRPGEVLKVGVVPSGTTEKTVELPDGTTTVVPVSGNAWAYLANASNATSNSTTASRG
jgi:hypothetical protein